MLIAFAAVGVLTCIFIQHPLLRAASPCYCCCWEN